MGENLKTKIGSIVVKLKKFDEMLAFWQVTLHYVPGHPEGNGFIILRDPEGKDPNMSLDKALDGERIGSTGFPRFHIDLYAENQEDEVQRLRKIGATPHLQTYDPEGDFVALQDPDGNLFCVVQT